MPHPPARRIALGLLALAAACGVAACAVSGRAVGGAPGSPVVPVPLSMSTAYLVLGERPILVDAGTDRDVEAVGAALAARGLGFGDLALIVLTHGHADHAGGAARVAAASGAPVLAGAADGPMLRRGDHGALAPQGLEARLVRPFIPSGFPPVAPELVLDAAPGRTTLDLRPYGVRGEVVLVPGHTPGSLVVLLDTGEALVGDLFRGGWLGGRLRPRVPLTHYFHDDRARAEAAVGALLRRGVTRFYLGHGGPVDAEAARARFARIP